MDLVKVQLQMEGRRRLEGKPPRVKGVLEALTKIWKEGGIRGLWRGWVPNVQRGALVNLGDLTTYDSAKRFLLRNTTMKDGTSVHILSRYLFWKSLSSISSQQASIMTDNYIVGLF